MNSYLKLFLILLSMLEMCVCVLVHMNEPHLKVFDNQNISLTCRTEQPKNLSTRLAVSVRARMVLTLLQIPRGRKLHQLVGGVHCNLKRTKCETEFNVGVNSISSMIDTSRPLDTLESACQLLDDQICSNQWLRLHSYDCVALGTVTIVKVFGNNRQYITKSAEPTIGGEETTTGQHNNYDYDLERPTKNINQTKTSSILIYTLFIILLLVAIFLAIFIIRRDCLPKSIKSSGH